MEAAVVHDQPQHVERIALRDVLRAAEGSVLEELRDAGQLLRGAVDAVIRGDDGDASSVIAQSGDVARRHADAHDQLMALIACHAPMAGDLRLAIALLHVNDRVERIYSQCMNVAKLTQAMPAGVKPARSQLDCLSEMAALAVEQIDDAASIFTRRDADGVVRLREHDLGINRHNRECFVIAVHDGGDEAHREVALLVAMMARALERAGDNAIDIAQQATFVATGKLRPDAAR